jgi:virulence factor Mce-like protein
MSRGRGTASIVASPVLIGAVTTLIVIVSVFLAYNANKGLPFVPTYDISAQVPGGANLVEGNEVRVGGFRVGIVNKIRTRFRKTPPDGKLRAVAVLDLKLDKKVEPLAKDSRVIVRPRSALGLKYVQITPGKSKETFPAGATIPLENAGNPVEFDDLLNTFDQKTRQYQQEGLTGFGDAFAGRGPDINEAIHSLSPFFDALTPVMKNLSSSRTDLKNFFKEIGQTSAEVRPVAGQQAELFTLMRITFDAITRDPEAFRATIEKTPPTLDTGIRSLPVQRQFLADFTDLSRRLRPTARILPTALPRINRALGTGINVLPETVALNREIGKTFDAVTDLVDNPNTLLALKDLTTTTTVGAPLLEYISPYQSVCSYGNYFFAGLGGHISEGTSLGTAERVIVKDDNQNNQDNKWSDFPADRPADVPSNLDPSSAYTPGPGPKEERAMQAAHTQPFAPAIDAKGNADCQIGNSGYLDGPLAKNGRYPPANVADPNDPTQLSEFWANKSGGSSVVADADTPGLAGPTFNGVPSLKDVP